MAERIRKIVNIRTSALRKQVDNVITLVKQPVGVFETLDTVVKTFRQANRETLEVIGIRVPVGLTERLRLRR